MGAAQVPLQVHTDVIGNKIYWQGAKQRKYPGTSSLMGLPCAKIIPPITIVISLNTAQSTRTGNSKTIMYATMD
jgi:hypothetical protein